MVGCVTGAWNCVTAASSIAAFSIATFCICGVTTVCWIRSEEEEKRRRNQRQQ
jgi:hypothetical protein